jgi:GH24 family phage-related lysozyme (muramidase)
MWQRDRARESGTMFAPKIAKPQTKATGDSNSQARARSTLTAHRHSPVEQALLLQRTIGNQATLRLLAQRTASLAADESSGDHKQELPPENTLAREAPRGVSWDFSKIPLYPPDRASRAQPSSPLDTAPLPGAIQAKLVVGQVNDPLEREADRAADQVMRMSDPELSITPRPEQVNRKCATCEEDVQMLRTKSPKSPKAGPGEAPGIVHEVLRSPGESLGSATRDFFEPRFGHDFSKVRVHTDCRADDAARAVGALAFTVGRDIAFARGRFGPTDAPGQKLLAHELAHVVQQERHMSPTVQREDVPNDPYGSTEDGEQIGLFSLSGEGLEFIKGHEGCRLKLYNDSAGHCTIGIGHLVHHGNCNGSEPDNFKNGISADDASALFENDLAVFEACVSDKVTSRLNQAYYDALVSFTYNIGCGAFGTSGVLKQVNAKNYSKVPEEMMKWVKPPELKGRRTDEANLFRTGNYHYSPVVCT